MINIKDALQFARAISKQAGNIILRDQKSVGIQGCKDAVDIVTTADLKVEKKLIELIQKKYPNHNINSEEIGIIDKNSDYTWYIDPLDGTKEYYRRIPAFNTSMCLFNKKEPIISTVNIPYSNQLFSAARGIGAFLNGKKMNANMINDLKKSIIYINPPCHNKVSESKFVNNFKIIEKITRKIYRLRYSPNENTFLCFLALGSIEAYLNFSHPLKSVQDGVPGLFIAKMAGAKITTLKGGKIDYSKSKILYIASNSKIHKDILSFFS